MRKDRACICWLERPHACPQGSSGAARSWVRKKGAAQRALSPHVFLPRSYKYLAWACTGILPLLLEGAILQKRHLNRGFNF